MQPPVSENKADYIVYKLETSNIDEDLDHVIQYCNPIKMVYLFLPDSFGH